MHMDPNEHLVTVPCTVLEPKKDSFVKNGEKIDYAYVLVRFGTRIIKFPADKNLDLEKYKDKKINLQVEVKAGEGLKANFRAVGVK